MKVVLTKASLATSLLILCTLTCPAGAQIQPIKAVIVDEEVRTPEGSCFASSTIYEPSGEGFKSTTGKTLSKELIDEIRRAVIESESKTKPDLKDFGITPESVEKNRDILVQASYTKYGRNKPEKIVTFKSLAPELQSLFDFDSVSKNALATITGSMNSSTDCVRFYIPGEPPIIAISRHRQSGMLPWRVQVGEKVWSTYSRDLPVALSKIASPASAQYLSDDKPDFRFQRSFKQKNQFWPDGFFAQYGTWSGDKIQSFEDIQLAKNLSGYEDASKSIILEDAIKYDDGEFLVQVRFTKPEILIDRMRFRTEPKSKDENNYFHDWTDALNWHKMLEISAQSLDWLRKWKAEGANRSVLAMRTTDEDPSYVESNQLKDLWAQLKLEDKPKYYLRLLENDKHIRDVFVGSSFSKSIVTDLGPFGGPTARLPKVMQSNSNSVLRNHENGSDNLRERVAALIDNNGLVKRSAVPPNYALHADFPFPEAKDPVYNHSWPVDFSAQEDIEYIFSKSKMEDEEIESVTPREYEEKYLTGLVNKEGKVILAPQWQKVGSFASGLCPVKNISGKFGFVDITGKIVVEPQYDDADAFYEGLAKVKLNDKWGFIDPSGKIVIAMTFDSVRRFAEGLAPARSGARFGYIDKTGKYLINPLFGRARHFKDGLAYVQTDRKRAYIKNNGAPIGGNFYDRLERFSDKRALIGINDKVGFIDLEGNQVIPAKFDNAKAFRDGIAEVRVGNDTKAIDTNGNFVTKPVAHNDFWDGPITDGLVRISKEEKCERKYGFSDRFGKVVIKPIYDNVGIFSDGLCPVQINEKFGVIDKTGKLVIPAIYDHLGQSFEEKRISFFLDGKCGVLDEQGNVVIQPTYNRIYPFKNGFAVTQQGIKYGFIDMNGKVLFEPQFDSASRFGTEGLAQVAMRVNKLEEVKLP